MREVRINPGSVTALDPIKLDPGGTLKGRIVDGETGLPVSQVSIYECAGECTTDQKALAMSNADGQFTVDALSPGFLRLLVVKDGYADSIVELPADPGARARLKDVTLSPGGSIVGKVLDVAVRAVSGALVSVEDRWRHRTVASNGSGNYAVPDVSPGTRSVTKYVRGGGASQAESRSVSVISGKSVRVDVGGEGTLVRGIVRRAGDVLPGATVLSYSAVSRQNDVRSTMTTLDGSYTLRVNDPGSTHWLQVQFGSISFRQSFDVPEGREEIVLDVDIPPDTLRGCVIDEDDGHPLTNVRVTAQPDNGVNAAPGGTFGLSIGGESAVVGGFASNFVTETGEDGCFAGAVVGDAAISISFQRQGYVAAVMRFESAPRGNLLVRLRTAGAIIARVTNSHGEAVGSGVVYLISRGASGSDLTMSTDLSADGSATLSGGLDPGERHFIGVEALGMAPHPFEEIAVTPGRDTIWRCVLDEGGTMDIHLHGSLAAAERNEESGSAAGNDVVSCLKIFGDSGIDIMPLVSPEMMERDDTSRGHVRIHNAPAGHWVVTCGAARQSFSLARGGVALIELKSPP